MSAHGYTDDERAAIYRVIRERRDVRHFLPDPVDPATLTRIIEAAHQAPSVGFMQPWRFIRVTDPHLRADIHALVEHERTRTAEALGERGAEFMRLKVEGIRECGELLVAALCDGREHEIFGRRTLPEMDLASVACGIQNLWLAARAEGIGVGWVSLFDPVALAERCGMPAGAHPVGVLCIGHVEAFAERPLLETSGWRDREALSDLVGENAWPGLE